MQATEHARQRVMADGFRAYSEKFVAGWLTLQMLQVISLTLAQGWQSMLSLRRAVLFPIVALHCVHRRSVFSANSAVKEQTEHSVVEAWKKLLVRVTPHVVHVCSVECLALRPTAMAAMHATQALQCPGRTHHSFISSPLLPAALKPSAGNAFSQEKHCQRF